MLSSVHSTYPRTNRLDQFDIFNYIVLPYFICLVIPLKNWNELAGDDAD